MEIERDKLGNLVPLLNINDEGKKVPFTSTLNSPNISKYVNIYLNLVEQPLIHLRCIQESPAQSN